MISGFPSPRPGPAPPIPAPEAPEPTDLPEVAADAEVAAPAEAIAPPADATSVQEVSPPAELQAARVAPPAQVVSSPAPPTVATFTPISPAIVAGPRLPGSTAEVRDYIRRSAQQRGIDPDTAVRVVLSEGGLTPATWVGDFGSSFGPFQLHYGGVAGGGNAVTGLGDAFTAETHLDARDPTTWRQQVDWALNRASHDGWTAWHGAARSDIGSHDGIGVGVAASYTTPTTYATTMVPAALHLHVAVPNQFAANLSPQEAYAACGPAAAVAMARYLGRNPTVAEALQLAKQNGWTLDGGMNGISNEKRLLDAMHINAHIETPLNWRHVQLDASRGTPVIVSTPNHYWVIDDYDPVKGEYHVGQSGLVYAHGAEWMTADQIQQLGGGLSGGLYIDSPLVAPAPRIVDAGWTAPAASPATHEVALDTGWTRPGAAAAPTAQPPIAQPAIAHTAAPAAHTAVAAAPPETPSVQLVQASLGTPDRWWEDTRPVRGGSPLAGPEWV